LPQSILGKSNTCRWCCRSGFRETFPSLPDPPHPVSVALVARFDLTTTGSSLALSKKQAPSSPASIKNSTPARPVASFLTSAPVRTGVDFLPSCRSLEGAKFRANDFNGL
jgi:hypothetical protein